MQNMENVCELNTQTEQGLVVNNEEKIGSADLGKFKDVNALLHAYQSLQAEFTRRSQRLKQYQEQEKQRSKNSRFDNAKQKYSDSAAAEKLGTSGVNAVADSGSSTPALSVSEISVGTHQNLDGEALREAEIRDARESSLGGTGVSDGRESLLGGTEVSDGRESSLGGAGIPDDREKDGADARQEKDEGLEITRENKADAPCADSQSPCSTVEENISTICENNDSGAACSSDCADNEAVDCEGKSQSARVVEQSAQTLYELAAANEEVRLRIVGDYLSSIGKSNAPIFKGGVSALVTPPKKPRNLADAGNMALAYLKAYKEQV